MQGMKQTWSFLNFRLNIAFVFSGCKDEVYNS